MKKDVQKANKYKKICSTQLITRDMQIKTTTHISKWLGQKMVTVSNVGKDMKKLLVGL